MEGTDQRPSNVETMTVVPRRLRPSTATGSRPRLLRHLPVLAFVVLTALFASACAQNAVMNVAAARNEVRGDGPDELAAPDGAATEDAPDAVDPEAAGGGEPAPGEAPAGGIPGLFGPAPGGPQVADGVPPGGAPAPGPARPAPGQVPGPGAPLFPTPDTEFAGSNAAFCTDATAAIAGLQSTFQQTTGGANDPGTLIRQLSTGMRKSAQQFNALVKPAPSQVKPAVKTVAVELDKIASSMERLDLSGMQGLNGGPLSKALGDLLGYMSTDCKPKA